MQIDVAAAAAGALLWPQPANAPGPCDVTQPNDPLTLFKGAAAGAGAGSALRGIAGAVGRQLLSPSSQSPNMGDLARSEIDQIQSTVNQAGRPLEVVGSAARGARQVGSDIDYVAPPSSLPYYEGLENQLPGIDPGHGIIPGVGNPNIGPVIRFELK